MFQINRTLFVRWSAHSAAIVTSPIPPLIRPGEFGPKVSRRADACALKTSASKTSCFSNSAPCVLAALADTTVTLERTRRRTLNTLVRPSVPCRSAARRVRALMGRAICRSHLLALYIVSLSGRDPSPQYRVSWRHQWRWIRGTRQPVAALVSRLPSLALQWLWTSFGSSCETSRHAYFCVAALSLTYRS